MLFTRFRRGREANASAPRLSRWVRTLTVVVSVSVALLGCEAILRLFLPGENLYTTATLGILAPDPVLGWVHQADVRISRDWTVRTVVIRTDAAGHRIPDFAVPQRGVKQIALAGDSYVFGNEVNAEQTFVYLLGELAATNTINLGVNGYALSQECGALERFLEREKPAQAFLVIYLGNDIEYGAYADPATTVDPDGYLQSGPPSAGDGLRRAWTNARRFAVLHSRVVFAARSAWRLIHPPATANATPVAGVAAPRWIYDPATFTLDRLAEHRRVVMRLRDDARDRHVPLAVILMPEREQVYGQLSDLPNRMVSAMLADLGLPVIDLLPTLRQAAASHPHLWHEIIEGHLSPEGHQVVARILADWLASRPEATTPSP